MMYIIDWSNRPSKKWFKELTQCNFVVFLLTRVVQTMNIRKRKFAYFANIKMYIEVGLT
jgi:hypothetical protein